MKEITDDYPDELSYQSSLGGILNNLGMVLEQLNQLDDAAKIYEQAIEHQKFSCDHARQVTQYREFLGKQYDNYRRVLKATGHWEKDLDTARLQADLWKNDPEKMYELAIDLATTAEAIEAGKIQSLGGNETVDQHYADLAVSTIEKAIEGGLQHTDSIGKEPKLNAIRKNAKFNTLLQHLANPKK